MKRSIRITANCCFFLLIVTSLKAQVIYEAEDAYFSNGTVEVEHPGFTGDGFVDTENIMGVYLEWMLHTYKAVDDSIGFRYALGKDEHRTMQVYVNGVLTDTIDFDYTQDFTNYIYKYTVAGLNTGLNRIKLVAINPEGAPNLDHMTVRTDTSLYVHLETAIQGEGSITVSPPADSFLFGTRVKIEALPADGYALNRWEGSFSGSRNPLVFTADTQLTVTAVFVNTLPAFPGAEGFAANITGGRGGDVYAVTTLNDGGAGSLRDAISKSGKRTIVFRVSGTIYLSNRLSISNGDITIAGQTAPGDGITLAGYPLTVNADNVIIRFIRSRLGDANGVEDDAMNGTDQNNVILDHCTMSWSVDEAASFYDNTNFTMQYCLISESLYNSIHSKGPHGYGGIWGGRGASFHHNLLAHHTSRNPRFCGSRYSNLPDLELVDFRNNVIFNWGSNSAYGAEGGSYNLVNNYYKSGPATSSNVRTRIISPNADDGTNSQPYGVWGMFYVDGNYIHGYPAFTNNNWAGVYAVIADKNQIKADDPFQSAPVTTHTAEVAYEHVLAGAGSRIPFRDAVDQRIVQEVLTGIPTFGGTYGAGKGIIDSPSDVGGYPALRQGIPPPDNDSDGMPDEWETAHGLNPDDPDDRNGDATGDGYTNLEQYLNGIVDANSYIIRPLHFRVEDISDWKVNLTWDDVVENETAFLLERKTGDGEYSLIAQVQANSSTYSDEPGAEGSYTYRIRAANASDTSFYSDPVLVQLTSANAVKENSHEMLLFPNPVSDRLTVKCYLESQEEVQIRLYQLTGQQVLDVRLSPGSPGWHQFPMELGQLDGGIYLLELKTSGVQAIRKVCKE